MEQLRQGTGIQRPVQGTLPTTNTDGTPYAHGPEDYFLFYITDDKALITDPTRKDELVAASPPIAAELNAGTFDNTIDVDAVTPGQWFITYSTVNVTPDQTLEGPVNPTPLELEILAPLAPPLYPTNLV